MVLGMCQHFGAVFLTRNLAIVIEILYGTWLVAICAPVVFNAPGSEHPQPMARLRKYGQKVLSPTIDQ